MESNDELKEIDTKSRICYYFNDIMRVEATDFDNILFDEKSCHNILIYSILYKTFMDAK